MANTKTAKSTKPAKAAPTKAPAVEKNPPSLRVRMYRVGFGDFFLVTVPSKKGPLHIVVDCGVTKGKTGKGDIATIKTAVRHMAAITGGKLALVIVTHRHQDHIVGFSRCAEEFEKIDIDAIWMPYWETEYAPEAVKFQQDLTDVARGVAAVALAAAAAGDAAPDHEEILRMVENATGIAPDEKPGGGTNAKSLAFLKKKKPDYYFKGQVPKLPPGLVEAGLHAEILGPPPPKAIDFLGLDDFKKQYLDAAAGGASTKKLTPFGDEYRAKASDYPKIAFREWARREFKKIPNFEAGDPEAMEAVVQSAIPEALFTAAKKLDNMLNNQSLVVLFTWKQKKLLFAGDAQAGNWEYWLYDVDKRVKDPSGLPLAEHGKEVLGSIDFYKVGHHGSTNATPISVVEAMGKDFVAMCSTQFGAFGTVENESEVPRGPLMDALAKKSAVIRSDQFSIDHTDDVGHYKVPPAKGAPKPTAKPKHGKLVVGSCYVDYLL